MARKVKHPEHVNHERWLVSYADFMTLLFAFFVVMFAVSQVDSKKVGRFTDSFNEAVGLPIGLQLGDGLLPGAKKHSSQMKGVRNTDPGVTLDQMKEALEQMAGAGEELAGLTILRRRNELVLRMSDDILFASGDDALGGRAPRVLAVIAGAVRERRVDVRVEGHTDNVPIKTARFRSNWDLSTARATAVVVELARGGVLPDRLSAAGYGEFHPLADNATAAARATNRRVDLVVTEHLDDVDAAPAAAPSATPSAAPSATPSSAPTSR
jgi:chemotaxis protein MotB